MEDCKPVATPMKTRLKLSSQGDGESFDTTLFCQAIGCLIYLCNSRPDISYSVSLMSQFMHAPMTSHWKALKRIFRYLQGTKSHGLVFPACDDACLVGFSDSDWGGDQDTRRSSSGHCFFYGNFAISWSSKKQPTVATYSSEAKYRAIFSATTECLWLRRLLVDMKFGEPSATLILSDSQSAIAIARNPVFHARTKHIEIHYHFVRDRLHDGDILFEYCPTKDNIVDLFTKALPRVRFEALCKALNLIPRVGFIT
ncbi:hypothetical protein O6H91_09G090000 [Diphasiastrum complanatum]|uniref:Uncharacterized protein n=1 Tax=Diphasiastrum complanatum TaxID=34168 RepID=A0ACC2CRU7_DIPCM|nr:hypothetical protein O6H91_09G090000 [Diphasiastrum complanatum]